MIQGVFFNLDRYRLDALFDSYERLYGKAARRYAVVTYGGWKGGQVKMSGQTMIRLLDLLPRQMNDTEKHQLIQQLRATSLRRIPRQSINISISSDKDLANILDQALLHIRKLGKFSLPSNFTEIAGWITLDDAQALSAMISETEQQIAVRRLAALIVQLGIICRIRADVPKGLKIDVRSKFEIPTAAFTITFKKSFWKEKTVEMRSDEDRVLLVRLQQLAVTQEHLEGNISYIDYVMRTLTPEEAARLRNVAASEGLRLDVLLKELQVQTLAARETIDGTIASGQQLKDSRLDGTIISEHKTSSGSTRIEIHNKARPCYIATACYGDSEHVDVVSLRRYRDDTLIHSKVGRAFIRAYNFTSPPIANWLKAKPRLACILKTLVLKPLASRVRNVGK